MKTSPLHVVCAATVLQLALIGVHAERDAVTLSCGQQEIDSTVGRQRRGRYSNGAGGVVYNVEVLQDRRFTITTCNPGTDYDSYLSLYSDYKLRLLVNSSDDDCDLEGHHSASTIRITLSKGTYFVVVEGYQLSEGNFVIQTDCPGIPTAASDAGITIGVVAGMCIVCAFAHRCRARRNRKKVLAMKVYPTEAPEPEPEPALIQAPATTTPVLNTHGPKVAFTIASQGKHVRLPSDSEMAAAPVSAAPQKHKQLQTAVYSTSQGEAGPQPLPNRSSHKHGKREQVPACR